MMTVDTPRCKVARSCLLVAVGHADGFAGIGQKDVAVRQQSSPLYAQPRWPSANRQSPARPGAALPLINQHRRQRLRRSKSP